MSKPTVDFNLLISSITDATNVADSLNTSLGPKQVFSVDRVLSIDNNLKTGEIRLGGRVRLQIQSEALNWYNAIQAAWAGPFAAAILSGSQVRSPDQ